MSSQLTRKAEDDSGASTAAEGNLEHDAAFSAASDELSAGGMRRPQRPTTTTDDVSGSSNTSTTSTTSGSAAAPSASRVGALNVETPREGPPDRNDAAETPREGPRGRTDDAEIPRDQGPRGRNDDVKGLFKTLGKIFLGLTFQGALALMIYREQLQQGDSSSKPSSLSSILFTAVGKTMLLGFAFTLSGMMLQKHLPNAANFCSCAGVFSGALGFLFMMDIFAGKDLDWLVGAVGGVLLLVCAFTLCREMEERE